MSAEITTENPMGTDGFEFLEFASSKPEDLAKDFEKFGFVRVGERKDGLAWLYRQGDLHFIVNNDPNSHAQAFAKIHGPCVSAMGFRVADAKHAHERALSLEARNYEGAEGAKSLGLPAIYGIGDSLIYLVDRYGDNGSIYLDDFNLTDVVDSDVGLEFLDHVTHNVFRGRMVHWAEFYEKLFNFKEIRFFDIKGLYTGLVSKAMSSPCGKIKIPLNEATDDKSQIEEFIREYNGEGIQHIAMGAKNIYDTVDAMGAKGIKFLDVPDTYYDAVNGRVPDHEENVARLQERKILIDGNQEHDMGILLQLFTENMIGPVFFEVIQRKGNQGFGEGNFQALFDAMEQDQIRRGTLKVDES